MARHQVRVTSWPGSLKAREVQPAPAFCHSAKLSVCVSHDLCSVSLIYCCLSSYTNHLSSSMSKVSAKTNKGESRSRFRLCVPPCPRYITSGDTHSLCVVCLGAKHAESALEGTAAAALVGFAAGSGRGNGDGRVPIFFLTCQIHCPLSGIGSPFCAFFPPGSGLGASPIFLRGGWCGECWVFAHSIPTVWGAIGGSYSHGCQVKHRLARRETGWTAEK